MPNLLKAVVFIVGVMGAALSAVFFTILSIQYHFIPAVLVPLGLFLALGA
jgi:hypothetical protein